MATRIFISLIAMGADFSFYVKIIETHARAFLTLIILDIGRVRQLRFSMFKLFTI